MGGHFTDPYEQKTQQSPGLGLSKILQCPHWKKNWHALVGMMHEVFASQFGQIRIDSSTTSVIVFLLFLHEPWRGQREQRKHCDYPENHFLATAAAFAIRFAPEHFVIRQRQQTERDGDKNRSIGLQGGDHSQRRTATYACGQ